MFVVKRGSEMQVLRLRAARFAQDDRSLFELCFSEVNRAPEMQVLRLPAEIDVARKASRNNAEGSLRMTVVLLVYGHCAPIKRCHPQRRRAERAGVEGPA